MLKEYFESYRVSALRDLLPEFSEESKQIPVQADFPSLYEYLKHVTDLVRGAIDCNDKDRFLFFLKEHQQAAMAVQKSIVLKYDSPMKHGWKSFKFSEAKIEYDKFTLFPRVSISQFSSKPIVYADEMSGVNKENASKILEAKTRKPCYVEFLGKGFFAMHNITLLNTGKVVDWTGELKV